MSFKKSVQSSFSRAAGTYNDFSEAQQKAADHLVLLLVDSLRSQGISLDKSLSLLDIGCGTGVLEAKLRTSLPNMRYFGIDLSFGMAKAAAGSSSRQNSFLATGDMDSLPFRKDAFDIVVSSSTLQWSEPESFPWIAETSRVLRPNGMFCFNLMRDGSLENFYQAYREVCGETLPLHRYPNLDCIEEALAREFAIATVEEKSYRKEYPNLLAFLRDVQKTGARTALPTERGGLTKGKMKAIEETLKNTEGTIPIDYRFRFVACTKKT